MNTKQTSDEDSKLNFHISVRIGVGASPPPIHVSLSSLVKKSFFFFFFFNFRTGIQTQAARKNKKQKRVFQKAEEKRSILKSEPLMEQRLAVDDRWL